MADEQGELRRVNWNELFSFPLIFKSFKMAIHPSKLVLSLAAIVLLFGAGHLLSWAWCLSNSYVRPGEILDSIRTTPKQFAQARTDWQDSRVDNAADLLVDARTQRKSLAGFRDLATRESSHFEEAFAKALGDYNDKREKDLDYLQRAKVLEGISKGSRKWTKLLGDAAEEFDAEIDKARALLKDLDDVALKAINEDQRLKEDADKAAARAKFQRNYAAAWEAVAKRRVQFDNQVVKIRGQSIFPAFLEWEGDCLGNAISAVRYGNFGGGLANYANLMTLRNVTPAVSANFQLTGGNAVPPTDSPGFFFWLLLAWQGLVWLMCEHWLFATIYLVMALGIVALFGGAVHRIAALHLARDEKISMMQALRFSAGKFVNFFVAPLIPLAFVLLIGGLVALGGLVGNIPYVGEILMGALFILALVGGMLAAFLLVGLIGGVGLMYPTIAVEGSDSFDAISRSFSYIFARPWRAGLYGLVALVYGVATYLFVRLFVWLGLWAAHTFVGWGVFTGGKTLGSAADKLDVLWTEPTYGNLFGSFSWAAMNGSETIGAVLIGVWVFLAASLVVAYGLSYVASSTTAIYYLLRRQVDATDLDDVYVEEGEEPAAPAAAPAVEAPKAQTPPAEAPKGDETQPPAQA